MNLTNTTADKFGHLELSGPAHVRLEAAASGGVLQPVEVFSQLESTLFEMDENLWKVVLPKPAKLSSRGTLFDSPPPNVLQPPVCISVRILLVYTSLVLFVYASYHLTYSAFSYVYK